MILKNTLLYYVFIFVPMIVISAFKTAGLLSPVLFVALLMVYSLLYHPIVSGIRLVALKRIRPGMIFLLLVPGISIVFFRSLYFPPKDVNHG